MLHVYSGLLIDCSEDVLTLTTYQCGTTFYFELRFT